MDRAFEDARRAALRRPGEARAQGKLDALAAPVADALNRSGAWFTTSSCSGRVQAQGEPHPHRRGLGARRGRARGHVPHRRARPRARRRARGRAARAGRRRGARAARARPPAPRGPHGVGAPRFRVGVAFRTGPWSARSCGKELISSHAESRPWPTVRQGEGAAVARRRAAFVRVPPPGGLRRRRPDAGTGSGVRPAGTANS